MARRRQRCHGWPHRHWLLRAFRVQCTAVWWCSSRVPLSHSLLCKLVHSISLSAVRRCTRACVALQGSLAVASTKLLFHFLSVLLTFTLVPRYCSLPSSACTVFSKARPPSCYYFRSKKDTNIRLANTFHSISVTCCCIRRHYVLFYCVPIRR